MPSIYSQLAGRRGAELELQPLTDCAGYTRTNEQLHGEYAARTYRLLLEAGEDMSLCTNRLAASSLRELDLSFNGCKTFTDREAWQLAKGLPPTIEKLRLEFPSDEDGSYMIGAEAAQAILDNALALPHLRELSFCYSSATEFPAAIEQCKALETLSLSCNCLTGAIPSALGQCKRLKELSLNCNQLSGEIPRALGQCTELRSLILHTNQLSGQIPVELGQCTALQTLMLDEAQEGEDQVASFDA